MSLVTPKLLYNPAQIDAKIRQISQQIRADYGDRTELVCVCVLRGAVMFFAQIVRALTDLPVILDFVTLASYGDGMHSEGNVRVVHDLIESVAGRNVLVVEDIVDTGLTVQFLREYLAQKGAKNVRIATLLDKPSRRRVPARADYVGFELQTDEFVVGFGLDCGQLYRNLDGIFCLTDQQS